MARAGNTSFVVFPSAADVVGETSSFAIQLDFTEPGRATEDLAKSLFGQLDSSVVELADEQPLDRAKLQKMRSVESLISRGSDAGDAGTTDRAVGHAARNPAVLVNDRRIVIPVRATIDSEASFERASVTLKFNVYEERPDDTLQKYLAEPRAGSRLLRRLLKDESMVDDTLVVELAVSLELKVPFYRPLQAAINYHRKADDAMLIAVHLVCNKVLDETFTIEALSMSMDDLSGHVTNAAGFHRGALKVEELGVPLPVDMQPGDVYGCVFEATLVEQRLLLGRMRVRLDAAIRMADAKRPEGYHLKMSFESEVDVAQLFPTPAMKNLTMTFSLPETPIVLNRPFDLRIFVNNGTAEEVDLSIRKPLEALTRPIHSRRDDESVFVTTEQMIDIYYSEYEHRTPTFLPLAPETNIGVVAPGACSVVHMELLPVREGLHTIQRLLVTDRIARREFDLLQVLQIRVANQ